MADPWYARYPGDYGRNTADLSLIQHGALNLLLDWYYASGRPLPADRAALHRICRAFTDDEQRAVDSVVKRFFVPGDDGLHQKRADAELRRRAEFHAKLSAAGRRRWRKKARKPGMEPGTSQANTQAIASPQSQSQSQSQESKSSSEVMQNAGGVDDSTPPLEFLKKIPKIAGVSDARLVWAAELIRTRAKTKPRSIAFFLKAIPPVLENLAAETSSFLAGRAEELLGNGQLGDMAEHLKHLAAENDLPYTPDLITAAIASAEARRRRREEVESSVRTGSGPRLSR